MTVRSLSFQPEVYHWLRCWCRCKCSFPVCCKSIYREIMCIDFVLHNNDWCLLQLKYPNCAEGLVLLNCPAGRSTWTEWMLQKVSFRSESFILGSCQLLTLTQTFKMNSWYLRSGLFTAGTEQYLLWHLLGPVSIVFLRHNF